MNVYCKPYLLYGADVIEWNKSILSSISYLFKSVLCIIYKIKFESLDAVLLYTGQMDICHEISRRRCNFIRSCLLSDNTVISVVVLQIWLAVPLNVLILFWTVCFDMYRHFVIFLFFSLLRFLSLFVFLVWVYVFFVLAHCLLPCH